MDARTGKALQAISRILHRLTWGNRDEEISRALRQLNEIVKPFDEHDQALRKLTEEAGHLNSLIRYAQHPLPSDDRQRAVEDAEKRLVEIDAELERLAGENLGGTNR